MREIRKRTINIKKRTLAICIARPSTPLKPKTPAINATIKKITAQVNIVFLLFVKITLNLSREYRAIIRKKKEVIIDNLFFIQLEGVGLLN
jgi:hypothetical protein